MPHKIGIYCRVACADQVNGRSQEIQAQQNFLTEQVAEKNRTTPAWGEIIRVYEDDGMSGRNDNRPGLSLLREDIRNRKIDTVYVRDVSRLSRNVASVLNILNEVSASGARIFEFPATKTGHAGPLEITNRLSPSEIKPISICKWGEA